MKNDKRNLILDTTEKLMEQEKEISVNHIAEKAGIAKGSIYYYFKSKDEILYAVIERSYKKALHEYFEVIHSGQTAIEKIKILFISVIKPEFRNNQKNFILSLHLNEDITIHNKMNDVAVQEISPVLKDLLIQGIKEGSIKTETPEESAELIVALISFLLNQFRFSDEQKTKKKLKIFLGVLEVCLNTERGVFNMPTEIFEESGINDKKFLKEENF